MHGVQYIYPSRVRTDHRVGELAERLKDAQSQERKAAALDSNTNKQPPPACTSKSAASKYLLLITYIHIYQLIMVDQGMIETSRP